MNSLTDMLSSERPTIRLIVAITIGTLLGSTILPAASGIGRALFTPPADFRAEHWTAYEYAVESFPDGDLENDLKMRGQAGWSVVSARRATGSNGTACYEFVFSRPAEQQSADAIVRADLEVRGAQIDASLERLRASLP